MKFNERNHTTNKLRVNDCDAQALYFSRFEEGFNPDFTGVNIYFYTTTNTV